MKNQLFRRVKNLSCWSGAVAPRPLDGGITNRNFIVEDRGKMFVVRAGGDVPVHNIVRTYELAAMNAAHLAGVAPEIVYHEPGVIVMRHVAGKTLRPADFHRPETLRRVMKLLRHCHSDVGIHLRGNAPAFWVFHIIRNYARRLVEENSSYIPRLDDLCKAADFLEREIDPGAVVFCHNDLLAANFIDDGTRIWLIDWEYSGFNTPLFDLANFSVNNKLSSTAEAHALRWYFGRPPGLVRRRSLAAMKCASALREAMWSMVSETHSDIDFDYRGYTADYLRRFKRLYQALGSPS